ncbi:hypothetical protein [Actinomadura harenae]|uniref:PKD domain-containing protein n=1 Tax=Actinomadura harenae TaxID=2483351 RepID=A0A3M2LYX1_9ACTN|nr:hypothetical protein [Actinomadura harenae]RMI40118.1 hypothetical protein EBO15_27540 [Actinomadura harenae]
MLTAPLLAWALVSGCATPADWGCSIGAVTAVPAGSPANATAHALKIKPMCQVTGGADHCFTLPGEPDRTSTADVAAMAWAAFALPPPVPHTNPSGRSWVSLPTYLWVDASTWRPQRARAALDGQTVTVVGTPQRVEWSLGDATITCDGPGTPYRRGGPPSGCAHAFRRSGSFTVTATVYYAVTWSCAGSCDSRGGSYGTFPASGSTHLTVQEIQTRTGG